MPKEEPKQIALLLNWELSDEYLCARFRFVHVEPNWKPRNFSESDTYHGHLADLVIRAQANGRRNFLYGDRGPTEEDKQIRLYGWETEYSGPYSVNRSRAKQMYTTLQKLETGLEKLNEKYGSPESFPAYVARVLDVLKVTTIMRETKTNGSFYDDNEYRIHSVSDLSWLIHNKQRDAKEKWGWMPKEEETPA